MSSVFLRTSVPVVVVSNTNSTASFDVPLPVVWPGDDCPRLLSSLAKLSLSDSGLNWTGTSFPPGTTSDCGGSPVHLTSTSFALANTHSPPHSSLGNQAGVTVKDL